MVVKPASILILLAILTSSFIFVTNTTSLSVIDRNNSITVAENNSAYLTISTEPTIYVFEGETIEAQIMVITNKLNDFAMNIWSISPLSITDDAFEINNLNYLVGPYYGGENCNIIANVQGISPGTYYGYFEVEAFWGNTYSSSTANVHVFDVEIKIIVSSS